MLRGPTSGRVQLPLDCAILRPVPGPRAFPAGPCQDGVLHTVNDTFSSRPTAPGPARPALPYSCASACGTGTAEAEGAPASAATRFGPTHALILLLCVLTLGSGLFLAGTPLETVFTLLGGLGAIGAATLAAAGGGRRLIVVLAEAAVRGAGK